MTTWTILLLDGSTAQVAADELEVADDGALVFLVADAGPPSPLRRVFVLNARAYKWATAADGGVSFSSAQWGAQPEPKPPPKPPRMYPKIDTPDPLR
jgi:hypothetical protein